MHRTYENNHQGAQALQKKMPFMRLTPEVSNHYADETQSSSHSSQTSSVDQVFELPASPFNSSTPSLASFSRSAEEDDMRHSIESLRIRISRGALHSSNLHTHAGIYDTYVQSLRDQLFALECMREHAGVEKGYVKDKGAY